MIDLSSTTPYSLNWVDYGAGTALKGYWAYISSTLTFLDTSSYEDSIPTTTLVEDPDITATDIFNQVMTDCQVYVDTSSLVIVDTFDIGTVKTTDFFPTIYMGTTQCSDHTFSTLYSTYVTSSSGDPTTVGASVVDPVTISSS
jgi:hypothetical protein